MNTLLLDIKFNCHIETRCVRHILVRLNIYELKGSHLRYNDRSWCFSHLGAFVCL